MPRPPNPAVRSRLMSIGRDVILELGFNGCGVQDITAAAGVPKGSFYNYFDSKESFAAEILESYWESIEERHGPILYDARVKPLKRVAKFFNAVSGDHSKRDFALGCLIGNLSHELSNVSEATRARLSRLLARWEDALAATLREAQERGELARERDVNQLAAVLIEAYEGSVMRSKVERNGTACARFETLVLPLFFA
jgi:TetR/AcrR family transcriptional regulator, transcriptional repressor for nem operon